MYDSWYIVVHAVQASPEKVALEHMYGVSHVNVVENTPIQPLHSACNSHHAAALNTKFSFGVVTHCTKATALPVSFQSAGMTPCLSTSCGGAIVCQDKH